MDGHSTAKTLDLGANSAIHNTEGSDSIHEASHQAVLLPYSISPSSPTNLSNPIWQNTKAPAGEKAQGTGTPAFSKDGAVGSMFKADGAIGGTAEKVGGPFAKDGFVGLVSPFLSFSNSLCVQLLVGGGE